MAKNIKNTDDKKFTTAFVVAIDEGGKVYLELDKAATTLNVERDSTIVEVRRYTSEILMDLQAQGAAEYVLGAISLAQQASKD